jgi:hypothetical protein
MKDEFLETNFPKLGNRYNITSPNTNDYNCIAWAAGDTQQPWWPSDDTYWPESAICETSVEAFISAFELLGYKQCDNPKYENNTDKVALYIDKECKPTHMARQLDTGNWTSKFGQYVDIEHQTLDAIECELYGQAKIFLKRPKNTMEV